jgi:hypothetical protein
MLSMHRFERILWMAAVGMVLTACASQMEPAQKLLSDIEAIATAASPEAAKYVPEQLADVQTKLGALKASFDKKEYAAVLAGAPAVMSAAQGLAAAAAAKKEDIMKALNAEWTDLAAALPGYVTAIHSRIELLSKKSSKKLAAGIDLDAAKASMADASSLWSKAQAAFAAGNMDEAVATAKSLKTKLEALAATLKVDLAAPAAAAT